MAGPLDLFLLLCGLTICGTGFVLWSMLGFFHPVYGVQSSTMETFCRIEAAYWLHEATGSMRNTYDSLDYRCEDARSCRSCLAPPVGAASTPCSWSNRSRSCSTLFNGTSRWGGPASQSPAVTVTAPSPAAASKAGDAESDAALVAASSSSILPVTPGLEIGPDNIRLVDLCTDACFQAFSTRYSATGTADDDTTAAAKAAKAAKLKGDVSAEVNCKASRQCTWCDYGDTESYCVAAHLPSAGSTTTMAGANASCLR